MRKKPSGEPKASRSEADTESDDPWREVRPAFAALGRKVERALDAGIRTCGLTNTELLSVRLALVLANMYMVEMPEASALQARVDRADTVVRDTSLKELPRLRQFRNIVLERPPRRPPSKPVEEISDAYRFLLTGDTPRPEGRRGVRKWVRALQWQKTTWEQCDLLPPPKGMKASDFIRLPLPRREAATALAAIYFSGNYKACVAFLKEHKVEGRPSD